MPRPTIPRRKRIFVGCEGNQEVSFIAWVRLRAEAMGVHLHFIPSDLGRGAGNVVVKTNLAVAKFHDEQRAHGFIHHKAILLDLDVAGDPVTQAEVERIAGQVGMRVIWQDPCHNAILARMLGRNVPMPDAQTSWQVLKACWPAYEKNIAARHLQARLNGAAFGIVRAMPAFAPFFDDIGL